MSCVVGVITDRLAVLVADTRRCETATNQDGRHIVVSEDTTKIFRLSENTAIGFTGTYEIAMQMLSYIESTANKDDETMADTAAALGASYINGVNTSDKLQFVVVGINSNGKISSYTFKNGETKSPVEHTCETQSTITYHILCDTVFDEILQNDLLEAYNSSEEDLDVRMVAACDRYIRYVAQRNDTVNTSTQHIIIGT